MPTFMAMGGVRLSYNPSVDETKKTMDLKPFFPENP